MPAIINAAANLALGAIFALVTRRSAAVHENRVSWPLLLLLAFEAVVLTPIATYLFRFYPQWSMLYWFDPQIFVGLRNWIGPLSFVAILANFAAAVVGFLAARWGVMHNKRLGWWAPLLCAVGIIAYVSVVFGHRVAFIGDYDTFWRGHATLLVKRLPGWVGIAAYVLAAGLVAWVHHRFGHRDPSWP